MTKHLQQTLFEFLKDHYDPAHPVLLALSGGPDSLALFYLLLKLKEKLPISFGVAHIDHGWRSESAQEAEELQQLAHQHHIPFHLKKISPHMMEGNLEAACRLERLEFYKELIRDCKYQAVILGHHADDQAETVLKRILEGADITVFTGLQKVNEIDQVILWRPLLNVTKKEILQWLDDEKIEAFLDQTNFDTKYLRARFRLEILPFLNKAFGKEVTSNLCHLGRDAQELKIYLDSHVSRYLQNILSGPFGKMLDLSQDCPKSNFELRYLIKEFCRQNQCVLTRALTETVCDLVQSNKSDRQVKWGGYILYIDRRRLFLMSAPMQETNPESDDWKIGISNVNGEQDLSGWQHVWQGKVKITLPEGNYRLGPVDLDAPYPGKHSTLSKWWTNEKVPAFMRQMIPVIWKGDQICHEFLSGRKSRITDVTDNVCISLVKHI